MSIISSHKEYILERLLLAHLLKGELPTADVLEEELEEYMNTHPSLAEPTSMQADFDIERVSKAKASKIQEIASYISSDVSIVNRELRHILDKGKSHYERWTIELNRLLNKAKRIEHEVDTLLLLQGDTAGYFSQVSDIFVDTTKIDMENTDAKIDTTANSVSLDPEAGYSSDASGGSRIDLSTMLEDDVFFSVLSTTPTGYTPVQGSKLFHMFVSPSSGWRGIVNKGSGGEVVCELKARLSRVEDISVSKIVYVSNVGDAGGDASVTCMHSLDGYQWYMIDNAAPTQSLDAGVVSWSFPKTDLRWVKFLLRKTNYDEVNGGTCYYNFGASDVRLYGSMYNSLDGGTLVSQAIQPLDYEDKVVPFTKAALDACEENVNIEELGTDIQYYLSASTDGETWTGETQVEPSGRSNRIWPSVANFSGARKLDNVEDSSSFDLLDSEVASKLYIVKDIDSSSYIPYGYKDGSYGFVNTAIPLKDADTGTSLSAQHIFNSLEVWRNIFDISSPSTLVRGVSAGWGKDNDKYYCQFYVGSPSGTTFDFGPTSCVIDGVKRSGKVSLPLGVHSFSTAYTNWFNIYSDSYAEPDSEDDLEVLDPLYPYNHKLVLEGFEYKNSFSGEQKYNNRADIIAEYYCKRTSTYDLENNIEDKERYFSFVKSLGKSSSPTAGVLLYRNMSFDDYSNEKCRLLWNSGKSSYKYIKLKAILSTTKEENTPLLYSYRIKIGS